MQMTMGHVCPITCKYEENCVKKEVLIYDLKIDGFRSELSELMWKIWLFSDIFRKGQISGL